MKKLKVLIAGSTMAPLVKVGGLADVMESLPVTLNKKNIDVKIIIPNYESIDKKLFKINKTKINFSVWFDKKNHKINLLKYTRDGGSPTVWLIDSKHFFKGKGVYPVGRDDRLHFLKENIRFSFFCQAIVSFLKNSKWRPDIIHLNDWHLGLVPFLIKKAGLAYNPKTLFTIHNLAYQGIFSTKNVEQLIGLKFPVGKQINFLQMGIKYADIINTVSPTYAKEILTKKFGNGLEKDLKKRKKDLYGILNGINLDRFNPQTSKVIYERFSAATIKKKITNKTGLQKELGLTVNPHLPVFGLISRLVEQKGLDILKPAINKLNLNYLQLVILGTGEPRYEKALKALANKHPRSLKIIIGFNAELAQKIYAGSDFFLIPSRFEPCGLGQMISMRYGTLPIARNTGGLKDTVIDVKNIKDGNGLTFTPYSANALASTIKRAVKLFSNQPQMSILMNNALKTDFSWKISAEKYIKLYKKLIKRP